MNISVDDSVREIKVPSVENTTVRTFLECPSNFARGAPETASHNRTEQSLEHDASQKPLGEKATQLAC
jgi:hypothetical protein